MRQTFIVPLILLVGCGAQPDAEHSTEVAERPSATAPEIDVAWDTSISVYDVLGRDDSTIALVQVPRRSVAAGGYAVRPSGMDRLRIVTECEGGACVDGLVAIDQLQGPDFDRLVPCGVHSGRIPEEPDDLRVRARGVSAVATHPSGVCEFLELPVVTADERETIGDGTDDSWLERGLRVTRADGEWVSFYRAKAWFSHGAAHSNAQMACRTLQGTEVATLSDVLGEDSEAALRAVSEVLISGLEEHDERAESARERCDLERRECRIDPVGFAGILRESDRSAVLCFAGADGSAVERLRVRIGDPR